MKRVPNILTIIRIVMIPFFIAFFYIDIPHANYIAAGIFAIASLTDFFDGYIARKYKIISDFGKLMDPMADKLLVCSALIMLVAQNTLEPVVCIILLGREFIISSLRLVAASSGVVIAADTMAKYKTAIQLIALVILIADAPFTYIAGVSIGHVLIYISVVLSVWSCIQYFVKYRKLLFRS